MAMMTVNIYFFLIADRLVIQYTYQDANMNFPSPSSDDDYKGNFNSFSRILNLMQFVEE